MRDPLIGLVGKPSSGKSTTLNALTDADAKVGNFPFTTIDPNTATGYVGVPCACARVGVQCKPNYGWCANGIRHVPVTLLDVAGLVPGAHEGRGLGNKFLDDLRHADCLIHVVDASGQTDAEGKPAKNWDPLGDVDWLQHEVFCWVKGNLMQRWPTISKRHVATKSSIAQTLAAQFGGYGANRAMVQRAVLKAQQEGGVGQQLEKWTQDEIDTVVRTFVNEKFPTVLALNKCDHPDADNNVARIARKHADKPHVLCSALSEVFLRRLKKQGYIEYEPGSEFVDTREDGLDLKEMDDKLKERLENIRDMVLYRFGSTGVEEALQEAIELLKLVPVFPVRSISNMGGKTAFPDCILIKEGTTVQQVCNKVFGGETRGMWIEGVNGRLADDTQVFKGKNDILCFHRMD